MERMTDKRLAEVVRWYSKETIPHGQVPEMPSDEEMVLSLLAERARVIELEAAIADSCDGMRHEYAGCVRAEFAEAMLREAGLLA